jgi:pimeloyl-ACP methyl ester carboxylesterase
MTYPGDGRLPVIYVRGFAGFGFGTSAIDTVVDDPFYGFSQGSVHVRADSTGQPRFHQFESAMLRLITDQHYQVPVYGDQRLYLEQADDVDAATVWIHRFYDVSASTFEDDPADFSLEKAAEDLFKLIKLVLEKTGAPKVFLVAHSMGGLICRSALQRIIPEATADADGRINHAAATEYVARVFTYATPHGGISFAVGLGILERIRDATGFGGSDIFGQDRMYQYLTPGATRRSRAPEDFEPRKMPDNGFPVERLFCLVGSNPEDYAGPSSTAVGARSDGLVQTENAMVQDAHRAIVHRSHGGRYGIVNSEEGYQNLQRFLFGELEVAVQLTGLNIGRGIPDDVKFQLDVGLAIRGFPVLFHEQSAAHHCPVLIDRSMHTDTVDTPQPLLRTFLSSTAPRPIRGTQRVPTLRHAVKLRLHSFREEGGKFVRDDHLEQTDDWQDTLLVDIEPGDGQVLPRAWATWTSDIETTLRDWDPGTTDPLKDIEPEPKHWVGEIPLPPIAHRLMGENAKIRLTVTPRTLPV